MEYTLGGSSKKGSHVYLLFASFPSNIIVCTIVNCQAVWLGSGIISGYSYPWAKVIHKQVFFTMPNDIQSMLQLHFVIPNLQLKDTHIWWSFCHRFHSILFTFVHCLVAVIVTVQWITVVCHFRNNDPMPVIIYKNDKNLITLYSVIFSNILSHLSYTFY